MVRIFFSLLLALSQLSSTASAAGVLATSPSWLLGAWKFSGYIYQNELKPPLNPKLILIFEFFPDSTSKLFWTRQDEPGFCERRGLFSVVDDMLTDEIVWVNPNNNIECSRDPDMQLGKKATNEVRYLDNKLHLYLSLAGEPFIYVFERAPADN